MPLPSIWEKTAESTNPRPPLGTDLEADVVVVGAGIMGVTAALRLADAGRSVVLLEAQQVGAGDTGRSTGNLYETVAAGLLGLVDKWGRDAVRDACQARREVVDFIEQAALRHGAGAGFRRCPLDRYAGSPEAAADVEAEAGACRQLGLQAHLAHQLPDGPPRPEGPVLVLANQAQFHPLRYVRAMAAQALAQGAQIFEGSPVVEVDADEGMVRTERARVKARDVVLATHSPGGFHLPQAGMLPQQEYGVAARWERGAFPAGIFWAQGRERLSVRSLETPQGSFVICVGQQHKTGQHDGEQALRALQEAAVKRLQCGPAEARWSAQAFQSPDGLPYIGKDHTGAYVGTGFGTDGLVYGTLAAHIVADQILGREHPWQGLFKASRLDLAKSAKGTAAETVSVVKVAWHDHVTHRSTRTLDELKPGEGAVVDVAGDRVAAYREPGGRLYAVSPICTHLKCLVHWNPVETSWDCPCHGSRFAPDGRVLAGPALQPLADKPLPGQ